MPSQQSRPTGGDRQWVLSNRGASGVPQLPQAAGWRFTAMTYNVLSDALLHKYAAKDYAGVSAAELEWSRRLGNMLREIRQHAPDVLALQEVDRLSDFLDPLSKFGYDGCLVANTGHRIDGSAILWNTRRFALLKQQELQYRRHGLRHNEALLVQLQPLQGVSSTAATAPDGGDAVPAACQPGAEAAAATLPLTVATVHMAHDAAFDELIRPAQARVLLAAAQRLAAGGPVVVMGDFNSQPGSVVHGICTQWAVTGSSSSSGGGGSNSGGGGGAGAYGSRDGGAAAADGPSAADGPFAASSAAAADGVGRMMLAGAAPADAAALAGAPEKMRLASAYQAVCGREAGFTAIGINPGQAHCTVDYIWYTPQAEGCCLQPRRVLQSPDIPVLEYGTPSAVLPSDHIPLVAEFDLRSGP